MVATNNLKIDLLEQSQAQKEITVNEAIVMLDSLMNKGAVDKDLSTPPASPNSGDLYIVADGSTGDWNGEDGKIALYENGWKFIEPNEGMNLWLNDEDKIYFYNGATWLDYASESLNPSKLGINASADNTNRLSVNSEAILFNNNGNGVQVKLNKNAEADNASFLFQNSFSGRAEIGLTGDDNFHFKVSPDGSTFYDSIIVKSSDGSIDLSNDEVTIGRFLRHAGDADTYMNMVANGIYFRAGGNGDNLVMTDSATILNSSGTSKNTIIETDTNPNAFFVHATNETLFLDFNVIDAYDLFYCHNDSYKAVTFNPNYEDVDFRIGSNAVGLALWCYKIGSTSSRVHFNYSGKNTDFRVDSQTVDNAFLIDANLDVASFNVPLTLNGYLTLTGNGHNLEGGQIQFPPATDYTGTISMDCYANQIRLFAASSSTKELTLFNTGTGTFDLDVIGSTFVKASSAHQGFRTIQFSNNNVVMDNKDAGGIFFRTLGTDRFIIGSNPIFKNIGSVTVEAGSNLHDDYAFKIKNNADNYAFSIGAYGMSNKDYGSTNINYSIDIGNNLFLKAGNDIFIRDTNADNYDHFFDSSGDFVLRSKNGGDMLQLTDCAATSATQATPYMEFNYSNGIGATVTRAGISGFAASQNADFYLWNYASGGGFRIGCSGGVGKARFMLDQVTIEGANGAEIILQDNSAAANNGIFDFRCDEGLLRGRINNDAMDLYSNWLRVYTTDYTQIDEVELSGDIIDLNSSDYAVVRSEFRIKPSSGNAYLNMQTQLNTGEDVIVDFTTESATTRLRQYDGANSYLDVIDNGQFGTLMRFGLDNQGYVNVLGSLWINHSAYTIVDDTGNHAFRLRNGNSGDRISIESNGSVQICIDENNNQSGKTFTVYGNGNNVDGTELLKLNENGFINIPGIYSSTTALGSNVYINSNGGLFRNTSSKKYKKNIKPISLEKAKRVLGLNPITYKSKSEHDNSDYTYYGLIAEDLAKVEPRLVTFDDKGNPDGVQYDRFIPLMLKLIQNLDSRLSKFEINQN